MIGPPEMPRADGMDDASRLAIALRPATIRSWIIDARIDPLLLLVWIAVTTVCGIMLFLVYRGVTGRPLSVSIWW